MIRVAIIFAIFFVCGASAQSLCGLKEADESKTCISIRLPWQESPIYFCTEKANLMYKDRCNDHLARYCPTEHSNTTLLIATPWDCCTLTSTPDFCSDRNCPEAPFNRTCTKIEPDARRPWECCPNYFCEEGTISNCQLKRLKPGCLTPPKEKKGCVAFKDEHGCCNKYQCASEGKEGMCPMQAQALDFKNMMTSSDNNTMSLHVMTERSISMNNTVNHTEMHIHGKHHFKRHGAPITTDLRCVGDSTCPGQMKCCSSQMSDYFDLKDKSTTAFAFGRNLRDRAVYGYCMEPVFPEAS